MYKKPQFDPVELIDSICHVNTLPYSMTFHWNKNTSLLCSNYDETRCILVKGFASQLREDFAHPQRMANNCQEMPRGLETCSSLLELLPEELCLAWRVFHTTVVCPFALESESSFARSMEVGLPQKIISALDP